MSDESHFHLTINFPDRTRRYASAGLLLGDDGPAEARVIRWGPIERGVPSRANALESDTAEVTVSDVDHDFAMLLTGTQGHLVEGSSASITHEPIGGSSTTVWSGLLESWDQAAPLAWTFSIARHDRQLRLEVTPKAHLNIGTWSSIHPTAANLRAPIVYGKHSSISVTNEGFLDAVYVDTKRFRYLVGVGVLKAITCVYVDGSPASPADYTIINPVVDGRVYTVVEFSTTLDASTVSVDCEGLTDAGAGGGTLMENPSRILKNLLHSFVWGDWRQGTWLEDGAAPARLDTDMMDALETWFDNRGWRASYRIPCPVSGINLISSFCESHELRAFWTLDSKLGFRVEDPDTFAYPGTPTIRTSDESVFRLVYPGKRLTDRVEGEYVRDEIAGQFAEQVHARDVVLEEVEDRVPTLDRMDLDWSAAFVVDAAPTLPPVKEPDNTTDFPGANLQYWYKADAESYTDGDAVGTVTDQSGNARHLTQATIASKLTFRTERINGHASFEFDGEDDFVAGSTAWTTMHPSGTWTYFIVFKPYKIEAPEEVASGYVGHHIHGPSDQDFEGIHVGAASGGKVASATISTSGGIAHAMQGVNENEWIIASVWADTTYELHMRLGRGDVETVAAGARSAGSGNIRWGRIGDEAEKILASQAPPPESTEEPPLSRYFRGEVFECFGYNITLNVRQRNLMLDYLEARAIPNPPAQMEQARNVVSRRLWMKHRPQGILNVTVPLERALTLEILDRVWVESPYGPEPTGAGWGRLGWQKRPFSVQRIELDAENRSGRLRLLDRRPIDALVWETGYSRLDTARSESGTARFYPDVTRSFERASKVYHSSPADADLVVVTPMNEPAIGYDGELFEGSATNFLLRSSLTSGTTGLTLTGTGVNGSAIAVDTVALLFDPDITPNSLKFTAGDPHTSDLEAQWPDTESINVATYGQYFRLSIDHLDDSGATLYFRLKRLVDNNFWDDSGSTWGSTVDNPITNATTRTRFKSKVIDLGGSNTVCQLEILQQSGGTASRINRVFHVQLENTRYPSSRIVTDDTKDSRGPTGWEMIQVSDDRRCYWEEQGTVLAEVVLDWNSTDLTAGGGTVYSISYGTEPQEFSHTLGYSVASGKWTFGVYINPNTYTATVTQAVTAGTVYKVASRWTADNGELGLTNYTYSVFVDGTKGTDATGEAPPAITWDGEALAFGNVGGVIRRRLVRPYPMSDEEIARFEV